MSRVKSLKHVMEKLFVPSGNMGIPRRNMPQIEDKYQDDFLDYLSDNGVHVKKLKVKADKIKPIQKEIRQDIVQNLAKSDPEKLKKPVIISSDFYLLDGHHRWLALLNADQEAELDAFQTSIKMKDLLDLTRNFEHVVYKDNRNKEYDSIDPSLKHS